MLEVVFWLAVRIVFWFGVIVILVVWIIWLPDFHFERIPHHSGAASLEEQPEEEINSKCLPRVFTKIKIIYHTCMRLIFGKSAFMKKVFLTALKKRDMIWKDFFSKCSQNELHIKRSIHENIDNYNKDPFLINKANVKTLKHILQKNFHQCYWTQISHSLSINTLFVFPSLFFLN